MYQRCGLRALHHGLLGWLLPFVVVAAAGCGGAPESRPERAVAERSVRFLEGEVEEIHDGVRAARDHLEGDPEAAREALARAEAAVLRLGDYYLPLLDLRERTESALETLDRGDVAGCKGELKEMIRRVGELADRGAPPLTADLEALAVSLEEARVALAAEPERAPGLLVAIHRRLQDQLLKGHLALAGGAPEGEPEEP